MLFQITGIVLRICHLKELWKIFVLALPPWNGSTYGWFLLPLRNALPLSLPSLGTIFRWLSTIKWHHLLTTCAPPLVHLRKLFYHHLILTPLWWWLKYSLYFCPVCCSYMSLICFSSPISFWISSLFLVYLVCGDHLCLQKLRRERTQTGPTFTNWLGRNKNEMNWQTKDDQQETNLDKGNTKVKFHRVPTTLFLSLFFQGQNSIQLHYYAINFCKC